MPLSFKTENIKRWVRDFLYGLIFHQLYMDTIKYSRSYKDLVMLLVYGEAIGLPLLSNTIAFKILPYILKDVYGWKIRMLKERDLTDEVPEVG